MIKRILTFAAIIVLLSTSPVSAALSTEALAEKMAYGQELFDRLLDERNKGVDAIMSDDSLTSWEKEIRVKDLQDKFLQRSRGIHEKYREPFLKRIVEETNAELPQGHKIEVGDGTSIYEIDKKTKKPKMENGKPKINKSHRGMQGDLDLGGSTKAVDKLQQKMNKYGITVTSDAMDAPGYKDFKTSEVTINIEGKMGKPGSSTHLSQVQMDAFSKETYSNFGMKANQPGKKLVETNDHIKKAVKGFNSKPADLLNHRAEDVLQGMSKGTLKSIDSGQVDNAQLKKILQETDYNKNPLTFKKQLEAIKEGQLAPGAKLNKDNIEAFQEACKKVTQQAVENSTVMAQQEFNATNQKIKQYEELAQSPDLTEAEKTKYKNAAKDLQEDVMDSKIRIEQTTLANQEKLNGGNYGTFYEKNKKPQVKKPKPVAPSQTMPMKKGFKPGMMDAAGYGFSAYSIFNAAKDAKDGKISESEAAITIASETIDTGLSIATDIAHAGAIGTMGTGSVGAVATIAAPLIVFTASTYAVSQATEDGLKMAKSFKDEEIVKMIAKSKTEETVNTLQLTAEEMIKGGNITGDWRYFAKADDIIYALQKLHQATGDDFYLKRSFQLADHVDKAKEDLTKKYNCESIYEVRQKKIEEERKEWEEKQAAELEKKKAELEKQKAAQAEKEKGVKTETPAVEYSPPTPGEPAPSPTTEPVKGEAPPTETTGTDYAFKGKMRVMGFSNEVAMGIGPKDASIDLWQPIQQSVLQTLQRILQSKPDLIGVGKLSDAEWAQEKDALRKLMGQNLLRIAATVQYDPAYENLLNNWATAGYITRDEANSTIEKMKSNSGTSDKPDKEPTKDTKGTPTSSKSAKGEIVDYYYVGVWVDNRNNPGTFDTIPVKYGDYTRPFSAQGKSLYTNQDAQYLKNVKNDIANAKEVRYNIYPGKAELKNGKVTILSKANKPISDFGGTGTEKQLTQQEWNKKKSALNKALEAKAFKMLEAPELRRYKEITALTNAMLPEIQQAEAQNDIARFNALKDKWNPLVIEQQQLDKTPVVQNYKKYWEFYGKAVEIANEGTPEQLNDFIMQSGYAKELGWTPPPSFKKDKSK